MLWVINPAVCATAGVCRWIYTATRSHHQLVALPQGMPPSRRPTELRSQRTDKAAPFDLSDIERGGRRTPDRGMN